MKRKELLFIFLFWSLTVILATFSLFFFLCFRDIHFAYASVKYSSRQSQSSSDIDTIKDSIEKRHKEALEIYRLGEQYSKRGKVDEAIEKYRKALNLDPNLAEAHLNLGWSYALKRQEYNLALQETLEAIRLKPDLIIAYRNLGWIYRLQKKYDKVVETFRKVIDLEPENPENYINLGDVYVSDTRDLKLAIHSYQKGMERDPNNFYLIRKLGKVYEFTKNFDLAITEYKKALKLRPTDAYTYLFLAVTLGKKGQNEEIPILMKNALESVSMDLSSPTRWDISLLKFYAGDISEENLFSIAQRYPEFSHIHRCQALFYAGLKNIWEGKKSKGIEFLTECHSMGIDALSEYEYSKTELDLLSKTN